MPRAEYLERWTALHGGVPATGLVGGWLAMAHTLAGPLVRLRVGPDGVTLLGLGVALAALWPASVGGRAALAVAVVVTVAGVLDNLDGAVAVMTGRVTRRGAVLDAVCDRLADAVFVGCLWLLGAPGWLVVAGGAVAWLHEYLRARAAAGGMSEVGVVSISERPTRIVVTVMFALGAGIYPGAGERWALAGAAAWLVVGLVGFTQVALVVRRRLTG
ncbi:MAG: CDP-alcohol phosphatidyltransferase family protein [Actinobacteria bacterium]|nr:CDP-alcohol phosphatidyltransferase family protein [Actinomycetota bacterium]